MSQSLRDQLVQAGLASEEQARRGRGKPKAGKKQGGKKRPPHGRKPEAGKPGSGGPAPSDQPQSASQGAEAAPKETGASKRQRKREAAAAVAAIVTAHGRKRANGEVPYRFARGGQIKETWVSHDEQKALARGELALIGSQGRYALVPADQVPAIRAINPSAVLAFVEGDSHGDEEYGPPVPDDLMW